MSQAPQPRSLSDLSRLCLPAELSEPHRRLAWVNSICFLFLLIGLAGIRAPRAVTRPPAKGEEIVPVVFKAPPEAPKPEPQVIQEASQAPTDTAVETPQVVPVVPVADASLVAFAVPVQGVVAAVANPQLATAPLPISNTTLQPARFDSHAAAEGSYPPPGYPPVAVRNRYEGTVVVELTVDAFGAVTSARVQKSSGFSILDEAALNVVKNRWRFPPGGIRSYYWPCIFQLK